MKERIFTISGDNKGLQCLFKPIRCQEGYCKECQIYLDWQNRGEMLVVCAWCGKGMGSKPGLGQSGVSHGMCPACFQKADGKMKLRVMVFGNEMMTERLTVSLAGGGRNEVLSRLSKSKAMALLKRKRFDVAVVDGLMEGGEEVCRCVRDENVPVLLLAGWSQAEWQKLESLAPDGYISEGMKPAEVRAHLRAVVRRYSLNFYLEHPPRRSEENE